MKTFMLSFALAASFAVAALFLTGAPAAAADYPWCLRAAGESGGFPRCRYATIEQCQTAAAFSQGWCERNARDAFEDTQARQRGRGNR